MSGAETMRPSVPDCAAWPKCGRDVRGHCACDVDTVPVPRPDPVRAYLAKEHAVDALRREQDALWDAMTPEQRATVDDVAGPRATG